MTGKPLQGLKVVDMTHVLAGPYCTYQLGLLGADVIKIESLQGDMVRGWGGSPEQLNKKLGFGFTAQNAGKRSIAADITRPEGAELVGLLMAEADIVVENYRPGSLGHYGLDHQTIRARNPRVIYASISAFGHTGPDGHRPGFDDVVQATSGFMSINVRGDGPIRTGGPVLDYASGMQAASAILAAVLLRSQTDEGQHIDLAMQDVTMLLMNRNTSIAATAGEDPPPAGNRDGAMLGRFRTRDGYVMLAGYLPRHWRSILEVLELPQYAGMSSTELNENAVTIEAAVEVRLLDRTSAEWDRRFSEAGVVAGGVRSISEVLATGQPESRGLFAEVPTAAGNVQVTTNGYRINGETFQPASGVPQLGEHTREILEELGYPRERIEALLTDSIVRAI